MRWVGVAMIAQILVTGAGTLSAQSPENLERREATRFDLREITRVGGWDERPGYVLEQVTAGLIRADGTFVIADQRARQVRFFTAAGNLVVAVGRDGDGPGEFRSLQAMSLLGDGSVAVWDFVTARLTILGPEGDVGPTARIHDPDLTSLYATLVGVFPDTSVVMRGDVSAYTLRAEPAGLRRDSVRLRVYGPDGAARSPVLTVPGPERLLYRVDRSWGTEELLFAREVTSAVTASELLVASGDSLVIQRYVPSGSPRPAWVAPYEPVRPTPGDVAAEREKRSASARRRAERRASSSLPFATSSEARLQQDLERIERLDAYPSFPAFRALVVADGQTVWVEDAAWGEGAASHWHQLDADLRSVAVFELPNTQRLLAIGAGRVLVLERGEFDVESVILYQLEEPDSER
jgi:hypothetical protein